jgi:hypothetical protein
LTVITNAIQALNVTGLSGNQNANVLAGGGTDELDISVSTGQASIAVTLPGGYTTLHVLAPGSDTIAGNGAANFAAVFSASASVAFTSNGGNGTVTDLGSGDFTNLTGSVWSVTGFSGGADSVNSMATNTYVTTSGPGLATGNAIGTDTTPSNVVGLAGNFATVSSSGRNDLIETFAGNDIVSVNGSANVLINGGADTVYATSTSTAVKAFFNQAGGSLDFINNSGIAATVSGAVPGATGGSATAFGGTGGGLYIGGNAGNNSLIGGTGHATLVAAGTNNFLSAQGTGSSYATQNVMNAGAGGATMVGGVGSGYNQFYGGSGTDAMSTAGTGAQTFYAGTTGSENMTGSTVTGAVNQYIFNQDTTGSLQAVITNFRLGTDHLDVNYNGSLTGVSITGVGALLGGHSGSDLFLNDGTIIQLYGVSAASLASVVGGKVV